MADKPFACAFLHIERKPKGKWTLDSSIQSKIVAMALLMASEIERDLISQRTKEALRYKKEEGVRLDRLIWTFFQDSF